MDNNMLKIAFAGDLCLYGLKTAPLEKVKSGFNDIKTVLGGYDLSVANLECSLAVEQRENIKMNVPLSVCPNLRDLGVDIFCLANNHVKDSGPEALLEMSDYVSTCGLSFVGAGKDEQDAEAPLIVQLEGVTLGFLNVTDASHYAATEHEPGVAVLNVKKLIQNAEILSQKVDVVIVLIHADLEFSNYPAPWRVRLSRRLAKHCDMIIHHHSHTLQGLEWVENCLIAYSLGNFVFPAKESTYMNKRPGGVTEGMVLVIGLDKVNGKIDVSIKDLIPTRIGDFGFLRNDLTKADIHKTHSDIHKYSQALSSMAFLRRHHFSKCRSEFRNLVWGCYYEFRKQGFKKAILYMRRHMQTDQHRNWLRGFFTLGYF